MLPSSASVASPTSVSPRLLPRKTPPVSPTAALLALIATLPAHALVIVDFNQEAHDLFSSGDFSDPRNTIFVRNPHPAFIGAGYDFSGVGWEHGSGEGTGYRMHSLTLVTPRHGLQAYHGADVPGSTYYFVGADGTLRNNTLAALTRSDTTGDTTVVTLDRAFTQGEQVAVYRLLDFRNRIPLGQPALIYGSTASGKAGPRIGRATIGSTISTTSWSGSNQPGAASYWEGGDSGSPAFVTYTAPDGSTSLHVIGTAWFPNAVGSLYTISPPEYATAPGATVAVDPGHDINLITRADGYALKYTIYDDPANTTQTTARWTGAAGSALFAAVNWSTGASPHTQSVILDASSAGGVTALDVNQADRILRGILFKHSASSGSFTLASSGGHALTLARVGIRNESAATQTFDLNLTLADSQNWEAANGNLAFNGAIDTTGKTFLLVVGGAKDTAIHGVISGAGALGKDDAGTLTLHAANSYSGKTFIHDGTLRLGAGGALPSGTAVVFTTATPGALLDLAGRDQTISGLQSAYGGTSRVELGGGDLTINATARNDFAGAITGQGDLIKTGAGLLSLAGADTREGNLHIQQGTLRLASDTALSLHANVALFGAGAISSVLELAAGDRHATLGPGAGQISIQGNGGFGVFGGDLRLTLNGGEALEWRATPHFSGLVLSSATSEGTVEITNDIRLGHTGPNGTGVRGIIVNNGTAAVDARLSGDLTDLPAYIGGIQIYSSGVFELTGNNTYAGSTIIHSGALRLGSAGALSAASNLQLNGGVIEFGHGADDVHLTLGTAAGQARFTTGGGFSAAGADRSVTLNGGAPLAWGSSTHFVTEGGNLLLSSNGADATITFTNSINLGSGTRVIQVANGTAPVDARLSGSLSQGSGLTKRGAGTLELADYSGATRIEDGALRFGSTGALPAASNIAISGGVLEFAHGSSALSLTLGSGAGQIDFTTHGGFSAAESDRSVTLNGGAPLAWGSTSHFLAAGRNLLLSSDGADATLILTNPIELGATGSGARVIQVANGTAAVDARLSGNLSQSGGTWGLYKRGAGTLELTGASTYSGVTVIEGGALRLGSAGALPATSNLVLAGGVIEFAHGSSAVSLTYGTGGGQTRFTTHGGFSAAGADRSVTLNNNAEITWGDGGPLAPRYNLLLSSSGSDATVTFTNGLLLVLGGDLFRTVQVDDGSAVIDARLTGVIRDLHGKFGFVKTGAGAIELTAANAYRGPTRVQAGALLVQGDQPADGVCQVSPGATLGGTGRLGGNLVLEAGARLALVTRAGVTRGPRVGGSVTFEGPVRVTADFLGGPLLAGTYTLLEHQGPRVGEPEFVWSPPSDSLLRATFDLSDPQRVRLILSERSSFDQWMLTHFGENPSSELASPAADPDGDGIANLLEYALGGDPLDSDAQIAPSATLVNGRLRLTFMRIADPGLRYDVEASSSLETSDWQGIWSSTGAQNTVGLVTVDDMEPLSSPYPRRFLRLRVTAP